MQFMLGTLVVQFPKSVTAEPAPGANGVTLQQILDAGHRTVDFNTCCVVDASGHEYVPKDEVPADMFICVLPRDFSIVEEVPTAATKADSADFDAPTVESDSIPAASAQPECVDPTPSPC